MHQTERNFWLDCALLFAWFALAFSGLLAWLPMPEQQGHIALLWEAAHRITGLASLGGILVHILWHRAWLKALRRRPLSSLPAKVRANRVLDRLLWIGYLAVVLFGALDWILPPSAVGVSVFCRLHVACGIAWLLGIAAHLALHRKWIVSAARRFWQAGIAGEMIRQRG